MNTYKILRGSHGVWRNGLLKSFGPGDTTQLTAREAANMTDLEGSQVQLISEAKVKAPEPAPETPEPGPEPKVESEAPPETAPAPEPPATDYSEVLAGNVGDVTAAIEKMTDPDEIDALAEQEFQGKGGKEGGRKGVLNAARERLEALEGGSGG